VPDAATPPDFPNDFPLDEIVGRLRAVQGVAAIVLGGSWAAERARSDSDIDLGIAYRPSEPLNISAVREIASALNDRPNPVVTELGQWGAWVNGGAWLTIQGRRTDFIYRNLDLLEATIDECLAGQSRADFWQQPPYGFHSQIYCAEVRICRPLYDPEDIYTRLKQKVAVYPQALKQRQINACVWGAWFTLESGKKLIERGEPYLVTGHLVRSVMEMVQALYALNETYFMNDKYVLRDVAAFTVAPHNFMTRMNQIIGGGASLTELANRYRQAITLQAEIQALAGGLYTPKF
jgi:predicted nucleotidyltransferase